MKKYNKYKDSRIEWIGEIPRDWKTLKVKRIFKESVLKGFENEQLLAATQTRGVIPKKIYEFSTVTAQKDFHLLKLVEVGDFVISLRSFQGGIEFAYYRGIISPAYTILKPNKSIDKGYFRHLFKSKCFIDQLSTLVTGIREGQNINTLKFMNSELPLPSLMEQNEISKFLEEATKKLNKAIENKKRQIELLKENEQITINKYVTKGLGNNEFIDSGVAWIGNIPKNWHVKNIKRLTIIGRGASPRPIDDPKYFDDVGEFSWVRISDVTASNKYLEQTTQKLSDLGSSLSVKQFPGDIFISICGSVGKPIITKIKCCIHDGFVYFQNLNINREYLYYIFYGGEAYKGYGNWGTQLNLNTNIIGKIPIPVPSIPEQEKIVEKLNIYVGNTYDLVQGIEQEISKLEEYKNILINDVVTGKMKVTA